MTRRDLKVAALTFGVSWLAFVALAQERAPLKSTTYEWDSVKEEPRDFGARREFFRGPTATAKEVSAWVTTLNPGQVPHPPHRHPEPEIIVVKEGRVEFTRDGVSQQIGPGSVVLQAGDELHGLRNTSDNRASYYVIKFFPR